MKNEDDVIGNEITGGGSSSSGPLKSLLEVCPICGKEFSCNKTYHVYTALAGRRRQYYCSYSYQSSIDMICFIAAKFTAADQTLDCQPS